MAYLLGGTCPGTVHRRRCRLAGDSRRVEYDNPAKWQWWKLAALKNDPAATEPDAFIWIDDDINSDPNTIVWLQTVRWPHLVISSKTAVGVTRDHIAVNGEVSGGVRTH